MTKTISPVLTGLLLAWPLATGLTLPARGPLPIPRPEMAPQAPETKPEAAADIPRPADQAAVPTPAPKPVPPSTETPPGQTATETEGKPQGTEPKDAAETQKPDQAAEGDPAKQADKDKGAEAPAKTEPEKQAEPVDLPPPAEDPKVLAACLADLKAIGASFETKPAIDDEAGCGIAAPIILKKPLPDVTLEPEATIRCDTALQLARMTRDMLKPAAQAAFPGKPALTGIRQASGYVCRNRNSAATGKISEHAYGNAIDIAALRFGDEEQPVMIAKQDDGAAEAAFQRAFNAIACLYFTTVLSPGSDATHQDHMHLDVIERKSGFRYCR